MIARLITLLAALAGPAESLAGCIGPGQVTLPPPPAAGGFSVYSGCSTPPATPRATHYVDPVHGSMTGDGSPAHPWSTLSAVVAGGLFSTTPSHYDPVQHKTIPANPNAPIRPGDTVYLLTGDHGAVTLTGTQTVAGVTTLAGFNNPSMITIAAAPGATPVLDSLLINGAAGWVFQGLTIQGLNTTGQYQTFTNHIPDVWLVDLKGPHNNLIFDHDVIQSAPTSITSGWSMNQWLTLRSSGLRNTAGTCVAITNSTISNVGFGIASQQGASTLILGDTLTRVADDFIDFADNGMRIWNNLGTDSFEDGDLIHRDFVQFQPATEATVVSNVDIEFNAFYQIADGADPFPGNVQGVSIFDGVPENFVISNNVIVSSAIDGISLYGVQTATVANNVMVGNGSYYIPCGDELLEGAACAAASAAYYNHTPGIIVQPSKAGVAASNLTITGNIASGFTIPVGTTNWTFTHNLCLPVPGAGACQIAMPVGATLTYFHTPQTVAGDNVIPAFDATGFFTTFNDSPTGPAYNLAPKVVNPANP